MDVNDVCVEDIDVDVKDVDVEDVYEILNRITVF